jgi:competence protein ComEC
MKIRLYIATLLLLLVGLFILEPSVMPTDKVVFLDIGQGDSILFQRGTQQVLIDGGAGNGVLTRLGEELPWWDKKIEVVVSTHPDKDHLEGLLHVVRRYDVGLVLLPVVPGESKLQEAWIDELQKELADRQVAVRFGWRGQMLAFDGLTFSLLAPWPDLIDSLHGATNDGSIVMRADYDDLSVLLTGDAESLEEDGLLAQDTEKKLHVDVLKVGHHGGKGSTSAAFLEAVRPKLAAISVGARNSYGHPTKETLDRLRGVTALRTDQLGSIRLTHLYNQWLLSCSKKSCID